VSLASTHSTFSRGDQKKKEVKLTQNVGPERLENLIIRKHPKDSSNDECSRMEIGRQGLGTSKEVFGQNLETVAGAKPVGFNQ